MVSPQSTPSARWSRNFIHGKALRWTRVAGGQGDRGIVAMALNAPNLGYWSVLSDGGISTLSNSCNTPYYGSIRGTPLNAPMVGMAQM